MGLHAGLLDWSYGGGNCGSDVGGGWDERIYFECDENEIFMGRYATKSNSKGRDQSADFKRASCIIASMRINAQKQ